MQNIDGNQPMEHIPSLISFELSKALLDEMVPSLRGVAYEWDKENKSVLIYFYNEGVVTQSLEDHYSVIDNEASTRFFWDGKLVEHDFKIIRIDSPKSLPEHEYWVYRRKEPFEDPIEGI